MTIITHALITTLGVQALGLHGEDVVLAYAFGVGVDADHLLKAPFYLRAVGLQNKKDYYWRSSLQEPVALLWIVPLCLWLRTYVPALFFLIHITFDYLVRYEKMPFYPYSPMVTRGWLVRIPDKVKEAVLVVVLICANLWLFLSVR
jgi:hypothetical protein